MKFRFAGLAIAWILGALACGSPPGMESDSGVTDAGRSDGGAADAGGFDAGTADGGGSDAGGTDAGGTDAGVGGADAGSTSDAGFRPIRAMWIWDVTVVTTPAKSLAVRQFAMSRGINTLYLQIAGGPDDTFPTTNLMATAPTALRNFLNDAAANGLAVEFMFGRSKFSLVDYHYIPLALANQAKAFVQSAATVTRPTAMHLDIEPHGIRTDVSSQGTAWNWNNTSQHQAMLNQLFDLFLAMRTALAGTLVLNADVVHWLDSASVNPFVRALSSGSVSGKTAAQWAIESADGITLMDYSDTASTIVSQASTELAHAGPLGKRVVIGVETLGCKNSGGAIVYDPAAGLGSEAETFCNEGEAFMNQAFTTVRSSVQGPAFGGFAIHHYASYSDPAVMAP